MIDSELTWKIYIDYVYSKLIKFTSVFYRLRHKVNSVVLKMLYFAFVHAQLLHSIETYGKAARSNLNKLIILNNKTQRIIQNKPKQYYAQDLYKNYNFCRSLNYIISSYCSAWSINMCIVIISYQIYFPIIFR